MRDPETKIMTCDQAAAFREELHAGGKTLVVTNGCFDLLHRGHVAYLNRARQHGDALLVAVNSDAAVQAVKGPSRPIVDEVARSYLVASLECVDAVVVFQTPKPIPVFEAVPPDIYVKGGDYTEATTDREEYVVLKRVGARFAFEPFIEGYSTTSIIDRLRQV